MAAESIATAYGVGLAGQTVVATTNPLPTDLAGTSLILKDRAGMERPAPLFFVSPTQINFQAPTGTAMGEAIVTVRRNSMEVGTGTVQIDPVAPGLFAANANGQGIAAGVALRVRPDDSQMYEAIARFDAAQNRVVAAPIDLTSSSDRVFLILYGTGLRQNSASAGMSATIGGETAEVLFAGAAPGLVGTDQVNLRLPPSLSGRGQVEVLLKVDDKQANIVTVTIGNPKPSLTNLNPTTGIAGSPNFTLTVNGTNFLRSSVVKWNGANRPTALVSSTQLTAQIPASDLAMAGTAQVTVFNPEPGGGVSNALSFNVVAPNPVPTLASLSPSSATVGGQNFTLTVNGTNFVNGSVVRWNGQNRTTNFVSSAQVTAQIPASDLAAAGMAQVTVFNPSPGGGASNALT
ncbi:MAG: IPT/TIG domain-containing protein, partial [Tepidisphaeraceae bacterium]